MYSINKNQTGLISDFRKSHFIKGVATFMAFLIMFTSCTQNSLKSPNIPDNAQAENSVRYISTLPPAGATDISLSEFGMYIEKIGDYTVNNQFSKQGIVNYVNNLSQDFGYADMVDIEFFDEVMDSEFFLTTSSSMHLFLLNLKEKNKISENEFALLNALDRNVVNAQTDDEIKAYMIAFEEEVLHNTELSTIEMNRMLTFIKLLSGVMEPYLGQSGAIEDRNFADCIDCIYKNRWKIGVWTVLAVVVSVAGCAYLQAQTGFPFGLCVQAVWLAFAGSISAYCWKECFGKPEPICEDPECPDEFDNSFDNGFTCCTDEMEGASIITGQNGEFFLSVLPENGNCAAGWTFVQFTQTCMKVMQTGWENLHLEGNRFCVDANNCN